MRLFIFIFGIVVGAAGAIAYSLFYRPAPRAVAVVAPAPLPSEPALSVTLGPRVIDEVVRVAARDASTAAPAHDVRTEVRNGVIVVEGELELLGQPSHASAVLRPVLEGGQLRVDVVESSVGAMPVPMLEHVLEQQLDSRVRSLMDGVPITLTGVHVDPAHGVTLTADVDRATIRDTLSQRP